MNDAELTTLIRDVAVQVAAVAPGAPLLDLQVTRLHAAGITANMWVNAPHALTARQTLEWYAGQFLDIVHTRAWFAMNSWLNLCDKFAPANIS